MAKVKDLLEFINKSPTPYQVVENSAARLKKAGFKELELSEAWKLKRGGRYYVKIFGTALVAFALGKKRGRLRISAAHTDFPCFRLKPKAGIVKGGCGILNVEPYGGLILRSWLDRPLGIAGKVALAGKNPFSPKTKLVDFARPLVTIPSLAIHMDREVNDKGKLNPQQDMLPIATIGTEDMTAEFFLEFLAKELGEKPENILSYDLSLYPTEGGRLLGLDNEFISSPRLDNLTSVLASIAGIIAAKPEKGLSLAALFDNEEVGSRTKQGAASAVLPEILRRIYDGIGDSGLAEDIAGGFMLSADVAHAAHPSHLDKSDPTNEVHLGAGVVLKQAASQSYAGDVEAVAVIRALARAKKIPHQTFVNRSDSRGGSTLGSIASALLGIRTMDIGVPILAMHSAQEMMAASDQNAIEKLVTEFLQ